MSHKSVLKIIYIGCVVILFLPLLITPFTLYPMHYGRTAIFEIIVELLFLAMVGYILFGKNPPYSPFKKGGDGGGFDRGRRGGISWNLLDKAILVFLAVLFVASIFGVDFQMSFFGNMGRAQGVFTWFHFGAWYFLLRFLLTQIRADKKTDERGFLFLKILGFVSFLVTLSAIFSFAIPYLKIQVGAWGRISGTIGNPIFFASYLILPIFLSFYLIFKTVKRERYFWIFVVLLEIFALIQSGTRGAILGFVTSVLFFLVFGLIASFKIAEVKKWRKIFIVCLLVIFLTGGAVSYLGFSGRGTGFAAIDRLTKLVSFESTGETRLMAWQIAWQAFLERPILGWGPENFKFIFHRHYNPEYLSHGFAETVWDKPHNWILELASTSGVLGAVAYLGIFAAAFYYLLKRRDLFSVILATGLIAYFIQNLFIFETSNSLIVFFLVLAFINSTQNYLPADATHQALRAGELTTNSTKTPLPSGDLPQGDTPSLPLPKGEGREGEGYFGLKCFGFIVLAVSICFSLWTYHIKPLAASYYLAKADGGFKENNFSLWLEPVLKSFEIKYPQEPEALEIITLDLVGWDTKYQIPDREMARILPILAERLENRTKARPNQFVYYVWLGQVYSMMCERMDPTYCEKADESYSFAIKVAPERQDAKLLLAKVKLLKKDFEAAVEINREMVESQPNLPVTHWFLGLSLIAAGQKEEGILELEKGAGFGLVSQQNILYVVDLYNEKKEYNKIAELYKKLLNIEPSKAADWWARLAATYAAMGDKVQAEEAVMRAVEINPALEEEARAFLEQLNH